MKRRAGFSTLEVIAAIAVLALALAPLLIVQRDIARATVRQDAQWIRVSAQRNVLAFLTELNPMAAPQGDITLGPQTIAWTATPVTPERVSTGYPAGDGEFMVALYRIAVTVSDVEGAELAALEIHRPGWRSMRRPQRLDASGIPEGL